METILNSSILNSAILDSAILHKTVTQTSSIWLKLIHSHSTWWWQPSWILAIMDSAICTKKTSLMHSHSNWWWQSSWILLPSIPAILYKKKLHLFILTQLDDGSHLETLPCWIQKLQMLDSDTLLSSLRFTKKHSSSTLTLTQTNSI